jgi:hypothetical protein
MLESNLSRDSQLETHPNDEPASAVWVGASIVWIDFPMPPKLINKKPPQSGIPIFPRSWIKNLFGWAYRPVSPARLI